MKQGRYIFTSDTHLGAEKYAATQNQFITFINSLPPDTRGVYLLGDIFDFWFERKHRPTGYDATLKALSALVTRGVDVYFMKGNHDWWTFGRLGRLTGIKILDPQPVVLEVAGKRICIAHGDDLGPIGFKARLTRSLLKGRLSIFLARYIVPESWLYRIAAAWTAASRHTNSVNPYVFNEKSALYRFACEFEKEHSVDHFIFGHIHRAIDMITPGGNSLHILNAWADGPNWLEFDGENVVRKGGES